MLIWCYLKIQSIYQSKYKLIQKQKLESNFLARPSFSIFVVYIQCNNAVSKFRKYNLTLTNRENLVGFTGSCTGRIFVTHQITQLLTYKTVTTLQNLTWRIDKTVAHNADFFTNTQKGQWQRLSTLSFVIFTVHVPSCTLILWGNTVSVVVNC